MATPNTHTRRDAERNHETIVTAAIAVLADDPEATMAEIAAASGIGRSTIYRHFPDRDALVAAISERVHTEARALVASRLDGARVELAVEVLIEVADTLAGLGDRYRFMLHQDERRLAGKSGKGGWREDEENGVRTFITHARAQGHVRQDLDADWLYTAYIHVLVAAVKYQFPDAATQRTAVERTVRSLVSPAD
jgi:AcrR family transcriptional regulator